MGNIFFDFGGGSSVEKHLKDIQSSMEKISKKVSRAYGELSANSEMTNAFSGSLLNEISQTASQIKDQSVLMGQYASIMHDVQAEYMELDSQKSRTKGPGFLAKLKNTWNALADSFTSTFSMAFIGLIAMVSGGRATEVVAPDKGTSVAGDAIESTETVPPQQEEPQKIFHRFDAVKDVSNYSEGVERGKIRYCNQNPSYSSNNGWIAADSPGCKGYCNSAAASMALSYIGIDKSPSEVRRSDFNHGNTTKLYGSSTTEIVDGTKAQIEVSGSRKFSRERIDQLVTQFENDNGTGDYSPVLIHYNKGSGKGYESHWILLTGKNEDGTYQAIGPWSNNGNDRERCPFSVHISDSGVVSGSGFSGCNNGRKVADIVQYHRTDIG